MPLSPATPAVAGGNGDSTFGGDVGAEEIFLTSSVKGNSHPLAFLQNSQKKSHTVLMWASRKFSTLGFSSSDYMLYCFTLGFFFVLLSNNATLGGSLLIYITLAT
ncbi:unnamed protein product [Citrullus colocynthis]|uniref:Uncharacterized protein n=1 Tax=Citrullus colocynthis TaxID=252529 RepID=A0ABP0YT37_9ROSI